MRDPHSAITTNDLDILEQHAERSLAGCFVEVGVWLGGSAKRLENIAQKQGRAFFAYDTFEGIPFAEEGEYHQPGDFNEATYERVKVLLPHTTVVKGIFPESAVTMPSVAFAHIDCDQYRSIQESARYLQPLMANGGVMFFDDYGIEHLPRATQAVDELYSGYVQRAQNGKAFVVFNEGKPIR